MWRVESDPHLASGMAAISVLDRSPDVGLLRTRLADAAAAIPQLRRRAVSTLGPLAAPDWQDDPDFSIDNHFRTESLAAPADEGELCRRAVELTHAGFNRERPLWEFVLIEGLDGGRTALLQRLHHTVADGVGGVRLSERYLDIERNPKRGGGRGARQPKASEPSDTRNVPTEMRSPLPPWIEPVVGAGRAARSRIDATVSTVTSAGDALRDPGRWPTLARGAIDASVSSVRTLTRQVPITEHRQSPLWTQRSNDFGLSLLQVPLEAARAAAHALGGTVNDLFVTAAAGAAGTYHRELGQPVAELRMAMPVSTRADRTAAGNAFGVSRVSVPTGPDPRERFARVSEATRRARGEHHEASLERLSGLAGLLPTVALKKLARHQVSSIDFTTSNVRGAPFDLFVAGARIEANYPLGPLAGTAFNLTTLSYCGSLDMGLHIDRAAITDQELLHRAVVDAFAELLAYGE